MSKKVLVVGVVAFLAPGALAGNVFSATGPGGLIPDGVGTATPTNVLMNSAFISGTGAMPILNVWIEFSSIRHTRVGDLWVRLTAPNGNIGIDLLSRPGRGATSTLGFDSDFSEVNTYSFADTGTDLFAAAPPAVIGSDSYRPSSNPNPPGSNALPYVYTPTSFADTFGGEGAEGAWVLTVSDWAGGDTGAIGNWTVFVEVVPEPSTFVAIGIGLAGLALARRRK